MLRAGQLLPQRGFRRCASTPGVPPDAGSLLLGLLAAAQTGLPPAGEHGLTRQAPSRSQMSEVAASPMKRGANECVAMMPPTAGPAARPMLMQSW